MTRQDFWNIAVERAQIDSPLQQLEKQLIWALNAQLEAAYAAFKNGDQNVVFPFFELLNTGAQLHRLCLKDRDVHVFRTIFANYDGDLTRNGDDFTVFFHAFWEFARDFTQSAMNRRTQMIDDPVAGKSIGSLPFELYASLTSNAYRSDFLSDTADFEKVIKESYWIDYDYDEEDEEDRKALAFFMSKL